MEKEKAKEILAKDLERFPVYFDTESAGGGVHLLLGKISICAQLGLISHDEMGSYVDDLFTRYDDMKKPF